jgi:bifunctional DNase/RNase
MSQTTRLSTADRRELDHGIDPLPQQRRPCGHAGMPGQDLLLHGMMNPIAVDLVGLHIEATSGAPLVLLREHDAPHRVLPIFIGESEAASIAVALSGQSPPRPLTHDLMVTLVNTFDARVEAVEVTDVVDGSFTASLVLSGPAGGQRLDTRPSDAIALAVRLGAPLYVNDEVLEQAGAVIGDLTDDETSAPIDAESLDETIAEFRSFIDTVDPDDFGSHHGD